MQAPNCVQEYLYTAIFMGSLTQRHFLPLGRRVSVFTALNHFCIIPVIDQACSLCLQVSSALGTVETLPDAEDRASRKGDVLRHFQIPPWFSSSQPDCSREFH